MKELTTMEAVDHLSELLGAAIRGETIIIRTDDDQLVRLVPIAAAPRKRLFGSAKGLIHMRDDFDAPLDDFREYIA